MAPEEGAIGWSASKPFAVLSSSAPQSGQTLSTGLQTFPQLGHFFIDISAGLKHIADSFLGNSPPGTAFPCRIGRRARLRGHRLVRGCLARSYHAVKSIDRGHLGALAPITKKPP